MGKRKSNNRDTSRDGEFSFLGRHARRHARRGWPVFPCREREKTPLTQHGFKDATTDVDQIETWWCDWPGANIACSTGGVFDVLDVDGQEGEETLVALEQEHGELPTTLVAITGRGRHFYFAPSGLPCGAGRLGPHLDTRGQGGYVIVPPSIHPDGDRYRWSDLQRPADWTELPPAPKWLVELATVKKIKPQPNVRQRQGRKITEGQRNDYLFGRAAALRRSGMGRAAIVAALQVENEGRCEPPLGIDEVEAIALSVERYDANDEEDARPVIWIVGGELPSITDAAEAALLTLDHPTVFQRAGALVRIVLSEEINTPVMSRPAESPVAQIVTPPWLTEQLTMVARWFRFDGRMQDMRAVDSPEKVARTLLARSGAWRFPPLFGLVESPTLRSDGSVLDTPGYDKATGLWGAFDGEVFPPVPERTTRRMAREALDVLSEPLRDFPFEGDADQSVALAAMLTALVRHSLPSAPLFAFTAPVMSSGKSLLVDVAALIATGRRAPAVLATKGEDEEKKALFSMLLDGTSFINFDNIESELGSPALNAVLTQAAIKDRLLHLNRTAGVATKATFCATGNNLVLKGDLTTRALLARLDPKIENPEEREFDVNLFEWIPAHRGELVTAALTVLKAYHDAGRPRMKGLKTFGRFETWSDWIRGALVWCGDADPNETRDRIAKTDPVQAMLRAVVGAWPNDGLRPLRMSVSDMLEESSPGETKFPELISALAEVAGERGGINRWRLGKWLTSMEARVVDGRRLLKLPGKKPRYVVKEEN